MGCGLSVGQTRGENSDGQGACCKQRSAQDASTAFQSALLGWQLALACSTQAVKTSAPEQSVGRSAAADIVALRGHKGALRVGEEVGDVRDLFRLAGAVYDNLSRISV
jgi:hypothetical protein